MASTQNRGICPDDAEPTPEELAELERRKAEVQARWTDAQREAKSTYDAPRPVEAHYISSTEMTAAYFGSVRRPRRD